MDSASQQYIGPLIKLDNVSLGYGKRLLLDSASVQFKAGELVALLGRNGSGKSTLLRTLAGLKSDYKGTIELCGHDLSRLTPVSQARLMTLVGSGRPRVEHFRCFDLVALGRAPYTNWIGSLSTSDRMAVSDALEAVGMGDYARRQLNSLSDGECQRVMIARALAQDTRVIFLDEPTSFLDLPNRNELVKLLARLAEEKGKCIVYSTHELDLALKLSHRVCLLDKTQLYIGNAEEIKPVVQRVFEL